jgi:DNA primase
MSTRWHHTTMIPQDEIDRIEAENPPLKLAAEYGLETKKQGILQVAQCPFHTEKSASLTIYHDHFHCYGCGWNGKPIAFVMKMEGITFPEACNRLGGTESETPEDEAKRLKRAEEWRQRQEQAEAKARAEREAMRATWPPFCYGRTHDLEDLIESRVRAGKMRLDYAGPWRAQELGHLYFTTWKGHLAWVVGDRTAAAVRRLDGMEWEHHDRPCKSDTLPGSKKYPIGLAASSLPVIMVEGEPAYLATLAKLWRQGQHDDWEAVCMLGATMKLGVHAKKLKDRDVIIYADGNEAGRKGAKLWKEEATLAGARSVLVIELPPGEDIDDLTNGEELAA